MIFNHYTTQLRNYFENLPANSDPSLSHHQVIENGRISLFDFDYPIFDPAYKNVFETHFIRKFYMRQIGFETFGLFKFQLETWLIINMPYFNKLFESELLHYDPLTNSRMDSTSNRKNDKSQNDTKTKTDTKSITGQTDTSTNRITDTDVNTNRNETTNTDNTSTRNESQSVTDDNFNRELESNTPDGRLGITATDGQGVIEYASKITENNENNAKNIQTGETNNGSESSNVIEGMDTKTNTTDNVTDHSTNTVTENDTTNDTSTSTINDIEDYIESRAGKIGVQSYAKLVQDYRHALLRIENQIFDEMNELFMLVY